MVEVKECRQRVLWGIVPQEGWCVWYIEKICPWLRGQYYFLHAVLPREPPLPKINKKAHGSQDAAMIPKQTLPIDQDAKISTYEMLNNITNLDYCNLFYTLIYYATFRKLTTPDDLLPSFEPAKIDDMDYKIDAKKCLIQVQRNNFGLPLYILKDSQNRIILNASGKKRVFQGSDLLNSFVS